MPTEIARISSFQLNTLVRDKTVFFFPVGPLEDHGPHLPLGLDLEEANRLCFLTAEHLENELPGWSGIVMPKAPLGLEANTTRITITVRPHVLRDWLVDSCRSLMKMGFIHFVCFTGHLGPKQLTAIEEAGKIIRLSSFWTRWSGRPFSAFPKRTVSLLSASSALVSSQQVLESPFWPDPKEHGGKRDTSIALALEKSVSPQFGDLPVIHPESSRWIRNWNRRRGLVQGYWGDPAAGEFQAGEKELLEIVGRVFPQMRAVWEGAKPKSAFRTWYSILPPNKSFFKAWLLVASIVVFMGIWGWILGTALDLK